MKVIDFRSDTVTRPTEEMRQAMLEAEVGDDVYGEDPTVNRLEQLAASMLGKEAAVFVPTGTMGNQASIMAHTRPGDEIIVGAQSHIVVNEGGGAARLSGVSCAHAPSLMSPGDLRRLARPQNIHYPVSRLVCLENALGNGRVMGLEQMRAIDEAARDLNLKIHLDGARLFNAAASLGEPARALAACVDSLSVCLSKGLCAPAGSLICGPADFAAEVRRCRKVLGGGMRQAGVLAACGLIALEKMSGRLAEDHEKARRLGQLLAGMEQVAIDTESIEINMVFWESRLDFDDDEFLAFMAARGLKLSGRVDGQFRLVTHNDVSLDDVDFLAGELKAWFASL